MRKSVLLCFALAAIAGGTALANAETPDAADVKTISACLVRLDKQAPPQEAYEQCLSLVFKPCMKGDEASAGSGEQIACYDRERLVWDKIVNDSYKTLSDALDDGQRTKLRDMQRSWIRTRDATCAFLYDYFEGSMAYPMVASCNNRETARRAIYLRIFALDISQRK